MMLLHSWPHYSGETHGGVKHPSRPSGAGEEPLAPDRPWYCVCWVQNESRQYVGSGRNGCAFSEWRMCSAHRGGDGKDAVGRFRL